MTIAIDAPIATVIGIRHRHDQPEYFGLIIKCPWCRNQHDHGGRMVDLENESHGHRLPHCDDWSLTRAGRRLDRRPDGYFIGPVPELLRERLYARLALTLERPSRGGDPITVKLTAAERVALSED